MATRRPGGGWQPCLTALVIAVASSAAGCFPTVTGADRSTPLYAASSYPDGAPFARGDGEIDRPRLFVFQPPPEQRRPVVVVIASGGSYGHHGGLLSEGTATARWLTRQGITAVVLRYRVGELSWPGRGYGHRAIFADGRRAVRWVRHEAPSLGLRNPVVGIVGFSAGGHLAGYLATTCAGDRGAPVPRDAVDRESCAVDFATLVYPVATMEEPWVHRRSRENLGQDPGLPEASLERLVHGGTPPLFLVHSRRDGKVPYQNSTALAAAARERGVDVTLLLYDDGGHGVALGEGAGSMASWPASVLAGWRRRGLLADR